MSSVGQNRRALGKVSVVFAGTPLPIAPELLVAAQKSHYTLVTELIDDSQGQHEFSEAHLDHIYDYLRNVSLLGQESAPVETLLQQFNQHQSKY